MTFISYEFLIFLAGLMFLYFILPLRIRYLLLLAASLLFYLQAGVEKLPFLLVAGLITYITALLIDRIYKEDNNKEKAKIPLCFGVISLLVMLIYAKVGKDLAVLMRDLLEGQGLSFQVVVPLGISYYSFAALGYLADIYWKKDKAEYNPFKLLLFLCYFPQILQGPIPKHKKIAPALSEGHRFDYNRICFGLQRVLWGFLKKLVIADRLAIMVKEVFTNYLLYEGFVFLFGLTGAVFQLYCDFSGCMDIALGVSEVFGIELEENFKRPFFAKSASEFWRRWHISLGTWFKDYIYMPLSVNGSLMNAAKRLRTKGHKRATKNLLAVVPLMVVWFLTGLWHGTGPDYIVWGCYWGVLISLSSVLAPEIKKLNAFLKIEKDAKWWQFVQECRTFILYMIGRLLTIPGNLLTSRWIGRRILFWNPWVLLDGTLFHLGWDMQDACIAVLSLLLLWRVSCLQESGVCIRKEIARWPLPLRWCVFIGGLLAVLIFGVYGNGMSSASFAYMNF